MTGTSAVVVATGAGGAIGTSLVNALLNDGQAVRTLVRRQSDCPLESVEAVIKDISDRQAVGRAVAGAKIVFHLAAKLHVPNPTPEMRTEYERVNVEGTRVLVEAARAAGVQRVVFFSTISVYGVTGSDPVDEDSAPHPDTIYAKTKLQAEEIALAAGRVYDVSEGTVHSLNEILAAMATALGRRPPRLHVPVELARVAAATADRLLAFQGRPPRLASAVNKFVESAPVRADRIQRELGFQPVYDLERGCWETIVSLGLR